MIFLKQFVKNIFQYEARLVLKKYKPKIIAITGSVGKTVTKDILYTTLSKKIFVRKSEKSFTTELGVPLCVIGCSVGHGSILDWLKNIFIGLWLIVTKQNYPDWLILEIDGDKPGDIENVSSWIKPNILIITAIGDVPSHIESFGSDLELFLNEKRRLIQAMPMDGIVFYNSDDGNTTKLVEDIQIKKVSCGLLGGGQFIGNEYSILNAIVKEIKIPTGMSFEIFAKEKNEKVEIKIMETIGVSNEYAVLLSFAVADYFNVPSKDIVSQLYKYQPLAGRMKVISGIKDTIIIDDSYNSSPIAVDQAIVALKKTEISGKKIFVIGDMMELGRFSAQEHRDIAKKIKDGFDFVICVGLRSRRTSEELLNFGFNENNLYTTDVAEDAGKYLQNIIQSGDLILVKGSQAMRMEKIVEEIMRHPEDKEKLLVRQEPEWQNR